MTHDEGREVLRLIYCAQDEALICAMADILEAESLTTEAEFMRQRANERAAQWTADLLALTGEDSLEAIAGDDFSFTESEP